MRKIWNKGHRIRASDKHLVYHFSIGTLLFVFVAVLLLLNRQNIADKRMELQKAQEARHRKTDGSATTGATRPHERPATASTISKLSAEKMQEVKRPATATTSKISEPVKTNVVKERPLSSGASDRKATQPTQTVHRQNVEKVVSQETRQNYTKDRRTKVQQTQTVQKNQQTTEKTRNLVTKKGQKKK